MALRYKVPQNVQREDEILFFITLRQLIILLVTGGISYVIFTQLSKAYILSQIEVFLCFLPLMLGIAFAFVKIKGISLFRFCLLMIEQNLFLPPRRYWQQNTHTFVSMTMPFSYHANDKKKKTVNPKNISEEKIKNLAKLLDGEVPLEGDKRDTSSK